MDALATMQLWFVIATNGALFFLLWASSKYLWAWKAAWLTVVMLVGTYLWMAVAIKLSFLLNTFASQCIVFTLILGGIGDRHDKLKAQLGKE
jgi:hypothetical protein